MDRPQQIRPVLLVILDGWGYRQERADNAIAHANLPAFDHLWETCPHALIRTSGQDVGLPDGQMGNSEVGHLNIGAGRLVLQDLPRISQAVETGQLAGLPVIQDMIARLKASGGTCHLMGLVSPGGVHSHQEHAIALARIFSDARVPTLVHVFTDGRDTPPRSAQGFLDQLTAGLPPSVTIATVSGRYYAMDRDNRWDRVTRAFSALVDAEGPHFPTARAAVAAAYKADTGDEFIVPAVIGDYRGMQDGDGVLCFNFRPDRVREILAAIVDPAFDKFPRRRTVQLAAAAGLSHYSDELSRLMQTVFSSDTPQNVLGAVVSAAGRRQLRIAETEKYPHVTYFFNGGREEPYPGEDRVLIPSPKVATYDLQPEMSAGLVTDKVVEAIGSGKYDLIVLNYANADMVGHTGDFAAAVTAVQAIDAALARLTDAVSAAGGAMLITADHGNCEMMRDPQSGEAHTAHTTDPVPVIVLGGPKARLSDGRLADIAPTLLELMGLPKPAEMTGVSLLRPAP